MAEIHPQIPVDDRREVPERTVQHQHVIGRGSLLRPVDGAGAGGPDQRVVDVVGHGEARSLHSGVEAGHIYAGELEQGESPWSDVSSLFVHQADAESLGHPSASVVGGASAYAHQDALGPVATGSQDEIAGPAG